MGGRLSHRRLLGFCRASPPRPPWARGSVPSLCTRWGGSGYHPTGWVWPLPDLVRGAVCGRLDISRSVPDPGTA
ncbi:hypothetical protein CZ771_13390 [Actinomycetales bacterium JB111]|nr:hypothetical protein CZ771_13390 [Actinomycetales bacterium JB111]